jgi:EAL domain-containing protein (putative c-di-GMP-specific phosphodiesterase class I)
MNDTEKTLATLGALKRLGVRLAIDDFGTGYSSLSYLRRFPIDELKIDRSFITGMQTGPAQLAVVRSIVKLGETLHLDTVAEGIELADQLDSLRALDASHGQGFLFSRPLDPTDLATAIHAHAAALATPKPTEQSPATKPGGARAASAPKTDPVASRPMTERRNVA